MTLNAFMLLILSFVIIFPLFHSFSFGQTDNTTNAIKQISAALNNSRTDTIRPTVNITNPAYPPTVTTGKVIIEGMAIDSESGIENVSAVAHTFPFEGNFSIPLASPPKPISSNDWSRWSFPLVINNTDSYRVVVTARDNSGNANYASITINSPVPIKNNTLAVKENSPKVAFVRPTFTEAAYQENGFYRFYFKYGFPPIGKNITTDLDMLTVKTPRSVSDFPGNDIRYLSNITSLIPINGTELSDVSQNNFSNPQRFWIPFINHTKKVASDAIVTVMRDEDVHDGHIFYKDNNTNAYDVLLLFHNEYVTQEEYDNLKQFVSTGGVIVFIDANALYAEVRYNRDNGTISLVKGHDWEFDGEAARRSIPERWYNETKDWVGSNFLINEIEENITFSNNPFNYTHFEEQFVNNPKVKIMNDYRIQFPQKYVESYLKKEKLPIALHREDIAIDKITVASYSMEYGKGKVIMMGLSGRLLSENQKFLDFFDNTILPNALCPKFQSCIYYPITHYLYGCTNYRYFGYHCDPISNEFSSYSVTANYTKVASATREPSFIEAKFDKGVKTTGAHGLESLRARVINAYDTHQFSFYISFMPSNYDNALGNAYMGLISYKKGIFKIDSNDAGWEVELVPSDKTLTRTLRFTVFDTQGTARSPADIEIPEGKFSEIAGTFDGKRIRLFVNGDLKSESSFPGNYSGKLSSESFVKVGGDAYCSCYLASGIIDEVRYYNYSLSANEIKEIKSINGIRNSGLIAHWKFDGDLKDSSSFKNDMFYNTLISSMAFAPDGRLFFTEKNSGNIRIMVNNKILNKPFASIPDVHVDFEQGLLGIAIDSKFEENHFIYAYYNFKDVENGLVYARIIRLTDEKNEGTDETVLLDRIPASSSGFHTGGALAFNKKDGKLYGTIGDAIDGDKAQNISSLNGKTIRINRDGSIPVDNPVPNSPVYTLGHRNMFGIAFNERGHGIVTEPGSALYDEINSQIKGANYGWPLMQRANMPPNPWANDSSVKPLRSYYVSENPTQAAYYDGSVHELLKKKFVVGSFRGDLYAYQISADGNKLLQEIRINTAAYPSREVVAIAVSPGGEIYFGAYDIFQLGKIDVTSKNQTMFPIEINATGIKVSHLNYSQQTRDIIIDLIKNYGFSTFSIKIPKSVLENVAEAYGCSSKTNSASRQTISDEVSYQTTIIRDNNYNIIRIEPQRDSQADLQFTINIVPNDSSRLNMCLLKR